MPFTFSVADMIYVYGFCDGNSVHAIAEYQQCFPNCRIPTQRVFTRVYHTLRDISTLPGVCIAAEHDVNDGVDEEEGIVQMVQSNSLNTECQNRLSMFNNLFIYFIFIHIVT